MDHPQPPAHAPAHGATQVKAKVYKQRIRLKDFFIDFDKLRSGYITQNQVRCTFPRCLRSHARTHTRMYPSFQHPLCAQPDGASERER
jgi:hypothetical protein